MKQKRRKTQPETTVHKDMTRDEFARQFTPESGRSLRQALELAKKLREGTGNE